MSLLTTGEVEDRSQAVAQQFFSNFRLSKECIHVFLSIVKNNELSTFFIINQLLREFPEVQLAVPKADFGTLEMKSYRYDMHTTLKVNKLGIPEPVSGEEVSPECFDIVLIPLLCFDQKGYRVGYGRGFYDRFLAHCKPSAKKIGLSLFPPVDIIDAPTAFDVPLDICIDPEQIHFFTR